MLADAFHLAAFLFVHGRVVSDQIPCDNGCLGTPTTFGLLFVLAVAFGLDHWCHLRAKALLPPRHQRFGVPRGLGQKTAEATETTPLGHAALQPREGTSLLTLDKPQQDDHKVLVLGFGKQISITYQVLLQTVIGTYNGKLN